MALEIGTLLNNRYKIIEIIAQGGMGAIYRAVDESLGVDVAVKENLFFTPESTRQFRREASLLAGLRQQNLPRVTDHFVLSERGQYLVMDYIEGEDLRQRINRIGTVPEEETILIAAAICNALIFLHNHQPPVIHRDIKPGNIKITPAGQVFLVDFGLAKISQPGQMTTTGAQSLTPGYAPPEQYGKGTEPRSDIYSLGATIYAALIGIVPDDAMARAVEDKMPTAHAKNPRVSEKVSSIIQKAMAIRPDDRYQSSDDFKHALLSASPNARKKISEMREITVSSVPAPDAPRVSSTSALPATIATSGGLVTQVSPHANLQPVAQRSSPIAAIIIGFLAVIGIGVLVVVLFVSGVFDRKPSAIAPTRDVVQTRIPVNPTRSTTEPQAPAITSNPVIGETQIANPIPSITIPPGVSPVQDAGVKIAFASNRSGIPQIWLMNEDGSDAQMIPNSLLSNDGACQPSWSPDGLRLAITSPCSAMQEKYPGSGIFIINKDGSGINPIPSLPGGDFDPAWSPDGSKIAFVSLRDGKAHIFIYDLENKISPNPFQLTKSFAADARPTWSPDGKSIAFQSFRNGNNGIFIIDIEGTRNPIPLSNTTKNSWMPSWSPVMDVIVYTQGSPSKQYEWQLISRMASDRTAQEMAVNPGFRPVLEARYSPDGKWLVYESNKDGNFEIYKMLSINGAGVSRLTNDPADDFDPAWQPIQ